MTYESVRRLGLALPDVEEATSYGTPALKVKGKVHPDAVRELLQTAHRLALPPKRRLRKKAARG